MPELYIIAGPNGAGKSTYSEKLVPAGVMVFDADKVLAIKEREFPALDARRLLDHVEDVVFTDIKRDAIRHAHDFAYETNFSGKDPLRTPNEFRDAGYRINLIYIGLPTVQMAISRVNQRVQLGGHDVSNKEIAERYKDGLMNVQQHIRYFDRVLFFAAGCGKDLGMPKRVMELEKGKIIQRAATLPKWAEMLSSGLGLRRLEMKQKTHKARRK